MAKDPVCGMPVDPETAPFTSSYEGAPFYFCSNLCRSRFAEHPELYAGTRAHAAALEAAHAHVAYFSMEIACESDMPTYSGGLGVLAGDTLRSFADLRIPAVAVSLVHHRGYFRQRLSAEGVQFEQPATWDPERYATRLPYAVQVRIFDRDVAVGAFRYTIPSNIGLPIPVLLLDTDLPGNDDAARRITDQLYGGDASYRIAQEIVLGIGGLRMLRAAGYTRIRKLHLNEGHAAFAALELLKSQHANVERSGWNFEAARSRCAFTTHTPVDAGHDRFPWQLVRDALTTEAPPPEVFEMLAGGRSELNMTVLAMNLSGFVNGVAKQHRAVTEQMFPGYEIRGVTNGVHSEFWTCEPFKQLYDRWLPGWRNDPATLRNALVISRDALLEAHAAAKTRMLERVATQTGRELRSDVLTLGFARRATAYKRTDLLFSDLDRLRDIARRFPLQMVFAGKAHPHDEPGKALIRRVFSAARELGTELAVIYLEDYDVELARTLVAGVDVWVNTPTPPLEASGTSGMKAAHNAVPSLSTLDGWWLEGHVEGVTGWSVGRRPRAEDGPSEVESLYSKLENDIAPRFYGDRTGWADVMRYAVALNASFFNTHRMVQQYASAAYL